SRWHRWPTWPGCLGGRARRSLRWRARRAGWLTGWRSTSAARRSGRARFTWACRSVRSAKPGLRLAGSLPVLTSEPGDDEVEPAAVPKHLLVQATHLAVASALLRPTAGLIALEVARVELAQRELRKGEVRTEAHDLAANAPAPRSLVADHGSGRAALVGPVDGVDAGSPHGTAFVLDHPQDPLSILSRPFQPLALTLEREREAAAASRRRL